MTCKQIVYGLSLMMLVGSCAERTGGDERKAASDDIEGDFASYAQHVYSELSINPLDAAFPTEVGLFGDISVGTGELVVMGQYRYRVDSSEVEPIGRMAFQIRDTAGTHEPIPVVLTFEESDAGWRLDDIMHYSSGELEDSLSEPLDAWVHGAVTRADEP